MKKQLIKSVFLISISLLLMNTTSDKKSINAKTIENSVAKISENLYAGKYELSNWLYRQFLIDLATNNRKEDLKIAQIDSAGWIVKPIKIEPYVTFYHTHSAYDEYPVVNISYEAANLFCNWLTKKYNSFPKKKFKNVTFRLPNEEEWITAAKGGKENPIYSTGNSLTNKKGFWMSNCINTHIPVATVRDTVNTQDILASVKSYWANKFGIYNMTGNAAEMISVKGITKGGSFLDKDTEDGLRIDAKENYQKPACNIGFRYFMQVIDK